MTRPFKVKHYLPNVVYCLLIYGCMYYIGCHTISYKSFLTDQIILTSSGCHLGAAYRKKLITRQELMENAEVLFVEEFPDKESAEAREMELIKEYQDKYGKLCLNICQGNKVRNKGIPSSEKANQLRREKLIGYKYPKSFGIKVSRAQGGRAVRQLSLTGEFIKEYDTTSEAEKALNIQHVGDVCRGIRQTAGNYKWEYV